MIHPLFLVKDKKKIINLNINTKNIYASIKILNRNREYIVQRFKSFGL
jgi:hypothetical protein